MDARVRRRNNKARAVYSAFIARRLDAYIPTRTAASYNFTVKVRRARARFTLSIRSDWRGDNGGASGTAAKFISAERRANEHEEYNYDDCRQMHCDKATGRGFWGFCDQICEFAGLAGPARQFGAVLPRSRSADGNGVVER